MYFVDRKNIEVQLNYMNHVNQKISWLIKVSTFEEALFLERGLHIIIEAIIDVGNQMIDGFIMRDPGSYEDIVEILKDEQVIPDQEAGELKQLISLRKILVQQYTNIKHEHLLEMFHLAQQAINVFPERIRVYLQDHQEDVVNRLI
jgi:uncharacterized protein YutE (UPF0331/DUF86 family)